MQTRYLRLVCRSRHVDYPLYLDAPVETTATGCSIVAKAMMCGFMRKESGDLHPFVVRRDKQDADEARQLSHLIDFGTDYDEPGRYFQTNLPSKQIQKAEQFTVRWFDEERRQFIDNIYEIREIIDLLRQQPV